MIIRCLHNDGDLSKCILVVDNLIFGFSSSAGAAEICKFDHVVTALTAFERRGATNAEYVIIAITGSCLKCVLLNKGGDAVVVEVGTTTSKPARYCAMCQIAALEKLLLCSDEGFFLAHATTTASTPSIEISKTKMNVLSDIGPQNKLLANNNQSTVLQLHEVGNAHPDVVILSKNAVTDKQALSWAVPEAVSNTLHLHWHMQTASSCIILATRAPSTGPSPAAEKTAKNATGNSPAWTCAYFAGELWVLSSKGAIGKFAVPSAVSSILITQETISAAGDGTVGALIISCAMGVFLQLTLLVTRDSCSVQASCELVFRSIGHSISPTVAQHSTTLFPSYQALVPLDLPQLGGFQYPEVFLACNDAFGVDVLALERSSDVSDNWLQEEEGLRWQRAAQALQRLHGVRSALPCPDTIVHGTSKPPDLIALCVCPSTKQSALFRLAPQSLSLQPFASVALEGADGAVCGDLTFHAPAQGLLLLSSRASAQSAMYTTATLSSLSDSSTAAITGAITSAGVQEILVPYTGGYAAGARTVGIFSVGKGFAQVTPESIIMNSAGDSSGSSAALREVSLQDLLTQSRSPNVRTSSYSSDGSIGANAAPVAPAMAGGEIRFCAHITASHLAVSVQSTLLIVECGAEPGNDAKVVQVLNFASDICALASAAPGIVCISLWSGDVLLFRMLATGVLAFVQKLPSQGSEVRDASPVRACHAAAVFLSAELSVHAVVSSTGDRQVTGQHIVHSTAQDITQVTTAATFSLSSEVRSVTALCPHDGSAAADRRAPLAVLVQTLGQDGGGAYILRCHVTLLDGCERQVPFLEWELNSLAQPIGRPLPAAILPVPQLPTSENAPVASSIIVGWLEEVPSTETVDTGEEEFELVSRLFFGTFELDSPSTHFTARAFIPGTVHSLKMCADQRHVLVAYAHYANGKMDRHTPLRFAGHEILPSCTLALYDTHSLTCVWQQQAVSSGAADAGALIGILPGPTAGTGLHSRDAEPRRFVSLIYALPADAFDSLHATTGAVSTTLSVVTYEVERERATDSEVAARLVPVGSVRITAESTYATTPISEREQQVLQSELLHFEALSADLLVVCMPDNTLRLVGWALEESGAMALRELQNLPLENKSAVVVEMKVIHATQAAPQSEASGTARVLVSLALSGIELYSLTRDATNPLPYLQLTHFLSNAAVIWTSIDAAEWQDEKGDGDLALVARDRLTDTRYTIKLWIPSYHSTLVGAELRCDSAAQALPAGVQESGVVRFLPSARGASGLSSLLLTNGQIVRYESSIT